MLLRATEPFRDLDRLAQQLLGTRHEPSCGDGDGRRWRRVTASSSSSTCQA